MESRKGASVTRDRPRAVAIGVGVVVLVLAAFVVGLVVAGDGGRDDALPAPGTPTTTAVAAEEPARSGDPEPTTTVANTPTTLPGELLGADGAALGSPASDEAPRPGPLTSPCGALVTIGWVVEDCGDGAIGGVSYAWVVETRPAEIGPLRSWRASLYQYDAEALGWVPQLVYVQPSGGAGLQSVDVRQVDLISGVSDELVYSFKSAGTGGYLTYDIVVVDPEGARLAASSDTTFIEVEGALIRQYTNVFGPDDPGCCPSARDVAVVRWFPGGFRIIEEGRVAAQVG